MQFSIKPIVCLLALLWVSPSMASTKAPCEDKAQKDPSCTVPKLDTVVVTANRFESDNATFVGQAVRLKKEDLLSQSRLIDSLAMIPGVNQGRDGGREIGQNYSIRGFGYGSDNRVIIQQDDVGRSTSLFSNHISSFRTDNDILKYVETVKGGSSILHGSGAIGGIVSMQTKEASDYLLPNQQFGFAVGGRIESNHMRSGMFQLYAKPDALPLDMLLHVKRARHGDTKLADGGMPDGLTHVPNDERVDSVLAKLGWDITPEQRLTLSAFRYQDKLNTAWQTMYHLEYDKENPVRGRLKQDDYVAHYTYKPSNNPWIDLSIKGFYSTTSYHRISEGVGVRGYYKSDYENAEKRQGLSLKNVASFRTGPVDHELITGLDYRYKEMTALFLNEKNEASDFGAFPNHSHSYGLYLQDNMQWGRLGLSIGGRYDHFTHQVAGRERFKAGHFSPRVAASFEVLDGINLLAGYSETFRAPEATETSIQGPLNPFYYYNPNYKLKPELAKEYEMGLSFSRRGVFSADDQLYFKGTYFTGHISDMISLRERRDLGPAPANPSGVARTHVQYDNLTNVKRTGFEAELKYATDDWLIGASYAHLELYNTRTHKQVNPYADKWTAQVSYTYQPWGLTLGTELKHWRKPNNDTLLYHVRGQTYHYVNRSFTQVNLRGQWKPNDTGLAFFDKEFTAYFGVNNVFDKKYQRAGGLEEVDSGGTGRNYYLQVEKRF